MSKPPSGQNFHFCCHLSWCPSKAADHTLISPGQEFSIATSYLLLPLSHGNRKLTQDHYASKIYLAGREKTKTNSNHKITKLCSAALFNPYILMWAQPGSKKSQRPTSHLLLQLSFLMSWHKHMNNHTPAIRFAKGSCANKGGSSGDEQLRSLTFSQDWLLLWSNSPVEGKV